MKQILDHFALNFPHWQPKSPSKDGWITVHTVQGVFFRWSFKGKEPNKELCVELGLEYPEKSRNDYFFKELKKMRLRIEEDMQCTLTWDQQPHAKRCLIYTCFSKRFQLSDIPRDPLRKELIDWGVATLRAMIGAFEDRLVKIR